MAKKKTYIVRAHARTVHSRPVTFNCAKCGRLATVKTEDHEEVCLAE